jgi:hypothetical protein
MTAPPQPFDDRQTTFDAFARHVNAGKVAMYRQLGLGLEIVNAAVEPAIDEAEVRRFGASRNQRARIVVETG